MKIKNYEIEMLDVKAADAMIIHIVDENDADHIILVDAGNYNDGEKIIQHLNKYYSSPKIDLAIVTHPDDDHYGGFFYLLEKIKNKDKDAISIDQFWVHDPGNHIELADVKFAWKLNNAKEEARSVLNYNENNLLSLIDKLKITRLEPFSDANGKQNIGHVNYQLYILGPTKEYYKSLALSFRNGLLPKANTENTDEDSTVELEEGKIYSKTLAVASDDSSKHNQSSLIFSFIPEPNKIYLFMGDAGREAFTKIPLGFRGYTENVNWLKVPHHGSKHNIDNDMINTIKPKCAYISTEGIGKYLSQAVVNALKKANCKVYSTHKGGNKLHNNIQVRAKYSTAEPL